MKVYTVTEFRAHLATAGLRLKPELTKTVNRATMNIQADWRERAAAHNPPGSSASKYPGTIVKRRGRFVGDTYESAVETLAAGQGKLGAILEYGGVHNAPQLSNVKAADAEAPNLAKWLAKIAAENV